MNTNVNPEILIVDNEYTSSELFDGISDREIVNAVKEIGAGKLARLLADYQDEIEQNLSNQMIDILEEKVNQATPDQLEDIIQEAKALKNGAWKQYILPLVQERNNKLAEQVKEYTNLEALDNFLTMIAKVSSNGRTWIPSPVYHTLRVHLGSMIPDANLTRLDNIAQLAYKWHSWEVLSEQIKARDTLLVNQAKVYEQLIGYMVRTDDRRRLLDNVRDALRLVETGEWEFEDPPAS